MSQSKAAPLRLNAAERRQRAVELRKVGFSYAKIAEQLGVSQTAAYNMVMKALKEINEKTSEGAEELRRLELERLDEWLLRVAQEIKGGRVLGAIDRGIRIMNRRAKLLGLDAPTKLEFKEVDQLMVNAICDAMAAGDPKGTAAFDAWTDGRKSVISAFLELVGRDRPAVLCTAEDIAGMGKPELEKAAQGLLTFEELTEIRRRAVEIKTETEGP